MSNEFKKAWGDLSKRGYGGYGLPPGYTDAKLRDLSNKPGGQLTFEQASILEQFDWHLSDQQRKDFLRAAGVPFTEQNFTQVYVDYLN